MAVLSLVSRTETQPAPPLSNPPADDLDMLIECNCSTSRVEATIRIRALIELSSLDSQALAGLARLVEKRRRTGDLARLLAET